MFSDHDFDKMEDIPGIHNRPYNSPRNSDNREKLLDDPTEVLMSLYA